MVEIWKQLIIARKDLNMSPGKLAAQVSHASMAFLTSQIKAHATKIDPTAHPVYGPPDSTHVDKQGVINYLRGDLYRFAKEAAANGATTFHCKPIDPNDPYGELVKCAPEPIYNTFLTFDADLFEGWILGSFTKIVCEARNKNGIDKAITLALDNGLAIGQDFFIIKDNCLTELTPEEEDPDSPTEGRTVTCIGFRPMPSSRIDPISKKFQLYR